MSGLYRLLVSSAADDVDEQRNWRKEIVRIEAIIVDLLVNLAKEIVGYMNRDVCAVR